MPRLLLHVEGAVVFAAATALYFHDDHAWWLYVVLALAPDLSMLGYAAGTRVGALAYNAVHTYALPVTLAAGGVLAGARAGLSPSASSGSPTSAPTARSVTG